MYRWCQLILGIHVVLCAQFKTMQRKQNLASALGIQKKLGVTMLFSEKKKNKKKMPYTALYFTVF